MTFWDWPLSDARLEVKADQSWISEFGEIDVYNGGDGGVGGSVRLTDEFQEIDFSAVRPLCFPRTASHGPHITHVHPSSSEWEEMGLRYQSLAIL